MKKNSLGAFDLILAIVFMFFMLMSCNDNDICHTVFYGVLSLVSLITGFGNVIINELRNKESEDK